MIDLPDDAALLVVDVQQGFDDPSLGERNNPDAESKIAALQDRWRETGRPLIHVQHMSTDPDSVLDPARPGNAFKPETAPRDGEPVVRKRVNSAFVGTELESVLRTRGIRTLVVVGLTTNHCVSTTVRMAENLGFDPLVVTDATAAFAQKGPDGDRIDARTVHDVAIANLRGEFARPVTTDELLSV